MKNYRALDFLEGVVKYTDDRMYIIKRINIDELTNRENYRYGVFKVSELDKNLIIGTLDQCEMFLRLDLPTIRYRKEEILNYSYADNAKRKEPCSNSPSD